MEQQHHNRNTDGCQNQRLEDVGKSRDVIQPVGTICNLIHHRRRKNRADDLRKSQRGNRQVIRLQAQNRDADQRRKPSRNQPAENHRDQNRCLQLFKPRRDAIHVIDARPGRKRNRQDSRCVSPDCHEACCPERKQTGKSRHQVHRGRRDRIDS